MATNPRRLAGLLGAALLAAASGQDSSPRDRIIEETMKPYAGPTVRGADPSTLQGKILCGYQGWFAAEGDGCNRGWYHWKGPNGFKPGSCKIDLWPDVTELDRDERYITPFRHADGRPAEVFSSFNGKTVQRHFKWMRDYGIDGVFVQRFAGEVSHPAGLRQFTTVLGHCREGANRHGRVYAVMYDLSGLDLGRMDRVKDDWTALVDRMKITKDPAYLKHKGRPVVAVWGVGFSDNRKYTVEECSALVDWLKKDPRAGGCAVMLGVPTYWRTLERDCLKEPAVHEAILKADILSPWTVGRYGNPKGAADHARKVIAADVAWCREKKVEYLPVAFPGFSWHNMFPDKPANQIPRLGGKFLWTQYVEAKRAGATMIYQAMFDEVDEGTAIFKCTNDPPVGESSFITYEGLPSDHYLRLAGAGGRMLRGEIPATDDLPDLNRRP